MGCEYELVQGTGEIDSAMRFGYEYMFKTSRVQGMLDTAGRISCMLQDMQTGFGMSGVIDYVRNDYKFGFSMQFAPAPPPGAMPEGQPM